MGTKHYGDITKIDGHEVPVVDVITGGSPCQDLSVAGKRAGLAGERSGLFMEQIRIIKEMRERDRRSGRTAWAVRPRYMVWENVPGAFSSGTPKGADFAAVIEEIIKVAEPGAAVHVCVPNRGWPKSGCYYAEDGAWSLAWRVHDAQFWGVPQRRKRIALVADFGGQSAPEILFERKGLRGDPAESGTEGQGTAAGTEGGAGSAEPVLLESHGHEPAVYSFCHDMRSARLTADEKTDPLTATDYKEPPAVITFDKEMYNCGENSQASPQARPDTVAPTVRADDHPSGVCTSTVRRLTPLECERLQGFPDGWTDIGEWTDSKGKKHKDADSPRYKALGNSIALPFWQYLARRMCAQYERPLTMASLFDGIGGFPLAFERCGARAVWASEIEEFPIAVTKIRFPERRNTQDA